MRILGSREKCIPLSIPPDLQSSTLHPPPPAPTPPTSPPINSITYLHEQGTGEDDYSSNSKELINIVNPVVDTSPRKCGTGAGTDDPSSEIGAHDTDSSISSSSSHTDFGWRWVKEDKDLPLKKRRFIEMDLMIKEKEPINGFAI